MNPADQSLVAHRDAVITKILETLDPQLKSSAPLTIAQRCELQQAIALYTLDVMAIPTLHSPQVDGATTFAQDRRRPVS